MHTLYRQMPNRVAAVLHRLRGKDVLTSDAAFRGTLLPRPKIAAMCAAVGLRVVKFRDDPTHQPGTRTFAIVSPAAN